MGLNWRPSQNRARSHHRAKNVALARWQIQTGLNQIWELTSANDLYKPSVIAKGHASDHRPKLSSCIAGSDHATSRHNGNSRARLVAPLRAAGCLAARDVKGVGNNRTKFLLHKPFKRSLLQMYRLTSSWIQWRRGTTHVRIVSCLINTVSFLCWHGKKAV